MEYDIDLYFKIRNALEVFTRINNRLEVSGEENIPDTGGALLCPNHENYSDPFFVAVGVRNRPLHFLAWHGIAEMPIVGPLFKRVGTMHPIRESYGRAEDKDEVKSVLSTLRELLESGELCVIFPSGSIKHWIRPPTPEHPFKPGAVRLAAQAGVPIIPVGLGGTRWVVPNVINFHDFGGPDTGFWVPGALPVKVRVRFGEPFYPDPAAVDGGKVAESETERLRSAVLEVADNVRPRNLMEFLF